MKIISSGALATVVLFSLNAAFAGTQKIPLTKAQAIELVRQLPEVESISKRLTKAKVNMNIRIEEEPKSIAEPFRVAVAESYPDHLTTLEWFEVSRQSSKISYYSLLCDIAIPIESYRKYKAKFDKGLMDCDKVEKLKR